MLKIGLTQRVEVLSGRDERRDCLDQAWSKLLLENGYIPVPLPNRETHVAAIFDRLDLAGVILTGGNDLQGLPGAVNTAPERDEFETALLQVCTDRGLAVLGVCRGMQLMVQRSGGSLSRVDGHVATRHPITTIDDESIPLMERPAVNSYHQFGVLPDQLGEGLRAAALAEDGTCEAVVHRHYRQWGIMWHPERAPHDPADVELIHRLFKGCV